MIKLRAYLKWISLIILLLFFIPWLITFAIYFGAPFLVGCGLGLSAFRDSPLSNSPQIVPFVYGGLIFLYYLFPFACIFYFFKVCRVQVTEKTPRLIWIILPFFIAIPLAMIVNFSLTGKKVLDKSEVSDMVLIAKAIVSTKAPWGSAYVVMGTSSMDPPVLRDVSKYPHKSYLRTCMSCYTKKNKLHCDCQNSDGIYNDTELDLTTVKNKQLQIQNCDGHLMADIENCP